MTKTTLFKALLEIVKFACGIIIGLLGSSCVGYHGYGYLSQLL